MAQKQPGIRGPKTEDMHPVGSTVAAQPRPFAGKLPVLCTDEPTAVDSAPPESCVDQVSTPSGPKKVTISISLYDLEKNTRVMIQEGEEIKARVDVPSENIVVISESPELCEDGVAKVTGVGLPVPLGILVALPEKRSDEERWIEILVGGGSAELFARNMPNGIDVCVRDAPSQYHWVNGAQTVKLGYETYFTIGKYSVTVRIIGPVDMHADLIDQIDHIGGAAQAKDTNDTKPDDRLSPKVELPPPRPQRVVLSPTEGAKVLSETTELIQLKNLAGAHSQLQPLDKELDKRLALVDAAIDTVKLSPRQVFDIRRTCYKALNSEFTRICSLPEEERFYEYNRAMNAMEYIIGKACCFAHQKLANGGMDRERLATAFFDFIEMDRNQIVPFALTAKTFRGRDRGRVTYARVEFDRKLMRTMRNAVRDCQKKTADPGEILARIADAVPESMRNGTNMDTLKDQLRASAYTLWGPAVAQLNRLLNIHGVAVRRESDGDIRLAKVVGLVQGAGVTSVVATKTRGFKEIFDHATAGFFCPTTGMIFMRNAFQIPIISRLFRLFGFSKSTKHHEVQHLQDEMTGFSGALRGMTPKENEDKDWYNGQIEATAIASELYHSDMGPQQIAAELVGYRIAFGIERLFSTRANRYYQAAKRLQKFVKEHPGMSTKEAMIGYIDAEYRKVFIAAKGIDISYTELYDGEELTPAQIVMKYGNGKHLALASPSMVDRTQHFS